MPLSRMYSARYIAKVFLVVLFFRVSEWMAHLPASYL